MAVGSILLVEGVRRSREALDAVAEREGISLRRSGSLEEAVRQYTEEAGDLLLLDEALLAPNVEQSLRSLDSLPGAPLLVVLGNADKPGQALACVRAGAFDYLLPPLSEGMLELLLRKADEFAQLRQVAQLAVESTGETSPIIGESAAIDTVRRLIRQVAPTEATVLIQGESGTGKELIAQEIHRLSPRSSEPFIRVNCAAIAENLIESEFFGHEKGAFTGAVARRPGRFELADGGTILLDEISEISPGLQAKLLRVLQEREFERVGGTRTLSTDVRVIATTNRDLRQSVARGEFREDLYYRLNVFPVFNPALRDRADDVLHLADAFLDTFARKHGAQLAGFSPEAREALRQHRWPGNVRELQNLVERAVILTGPFSAVQPDVLGLGTVGETSGETTSGAGLAVSAQANVPSSDEPIRTLAAVEQEHILRVLRQCKGNRTHAAGHLGISLRTLRNRLREYLDAGIDVPPA